MGFLSWLASCMFWNDQENETRKYFWFHSDQAEYASNPEWNYDQDDWWDSYYEDDLTCEDPHGYDD